MCEVEKLLVFLLFFFSLQLSVILCCLLIGGFYRTSQTMYTVHMGSVVHPPGLLLVLCSLEIGEFLTEFYLKHISIADSSPRVSSKYCTDHIINIHSNLQAL